MPDTTTHTPVILSVTSPLSEGSYKVIFEGPNADTMAIAFLNDRPGHVIDSVSDLYPDHQELSEYLYPTCEHGLSASLCYGPGHYPPDNYY